MPRNVARFEKLMYLALAIGVILTAVSFRQLSALAGPGFVILVQAGVVAVLALLIWLVARRGQNWARWTFLVLFIVGLPFYLPRFPAMLSQDPVPGMASAAQLLLQALAFYLVFTGDAPRWFRPRVASGGVLPGDTSTGARRVSKILLWCIAAAVALIIAAVALTYLSIFIFGYNR